MACAAPATVSTTSLSPAEANLPYSTTLMATGGTPPYRHWLVVSGTVPEGLTLNASTGVISGSANTSSTFTVSVQDSTGTASAASQSLTIPVIPPVAISTTFLPGATLGTAYSATLAATAGVSPYSGRTVSSGGLPPGLTLNAATGVISGAPTAAAGSPYQFGVTTQDSNNATAAAVSLAIAVRLTMPATTTVLTSSANPATGGGVGCARRD
jgi:hypothetical protein